MSEVTNNATQEVKEAPATEKNENSLYNLEIDPIPFEAQFSFWDGSSLYLEKIINGIFGGDIAPDFVGCKIIANDPNKFNRIPGMFSGNLNNVRDNGEYLLVFRFECQNENANEEDCNIILRNREKLKKGSNEFLHRMNGVLGSINDKVPYTRKFALTERTKQMLFKFLPDKDKGNPRWEERTVEYVIRKNTDAGVLTTSAVEIYGLSLKKFLDNIYDYKGSDGKRKYAYEMRILRDTRVVPPAYDRFGNKIEVPIMLEDAEYSVRVFRMDMNAAISDMSDAMHLSMYLKNFFIDKASDPNDKVSNG